MKPKPPFASLPFWSCRKPPIYVILALILLLSCSAHPPVHAADSGSVRLVRDIVPGVEGSVPRAFAEANGILFFRATLYENGSYWRELWKSDGTAAGTVPLAPNIPPPAELLGMNGWLFFTTYEEDVGVKLWKSDGTAAGTAVFKDDGAYGLTNVNGVLFFGSGNALWKSDGTPAGTIRVRDNLFPALLTNVNGTVFFVNGGSELWKSDGTLAGTQLIKAFLLTPPMPRFPPGPGVIGLTNLNGTLVFSAYDGTSTKLWRTDGTPSGTQVLLAKIVNIVHPGIVNNMLFFRLYNIDDTRDELWKTDGTIAGTTRVKESIHAASFASDNNHLFFLEAVANRLELWVSDGTEAGTHIVTPLPRPENELYYTAIQRVSADGRMLIAFGDPTAMALWQSNGTERGTVRLQTPSFGMDYYSDPPPFTTSGTQVFFTVNEPNTGVELWTLDIDSLRAPAVSDMTMVIKTGLPLTGTLDAVDLEGDAVTYAIGDNGTKGVARITNSTTGAFSYTPHPNVSGDDRFTFTASDGTHTSQPATVTVRMAATITYLPSLRQLAEAP